ncbi:MAG: GNAT family N-acetyltransferase [Spirochaetaceae bacterium]|nr:GNAT family N-acetyltransferase [Spirochaetaceae bacterium]
MNYRLAEKSDLDEICSLIKSAIVVMEQRGIFQWDEIYPARKDFLNDINTSSLFVGVPDCGEKKRITVVYALNKECDEEYKTADWKYCGEWRVVHRLCVHPDFQNRGIAKETLLHIENKARAFGANSIRLDVFSQNPFSLKLYERSGYHKTGEVHWRKGLFYLMEKGI